jgi:hypothetical protein
MKDDNKRFPGCPPSISELISRSAERGFLYFANQNTRIFQIFKRVIGDSYSPYMSAYGYFMGTIYVRTDSPHYIERFNYLKREWIKAVNVEMGMDIITDMVIKVLPHDKLDVDVPESQEYNETSRELKKTTLKNPE